MNQASTPPTAHPALPPSTLRGRIIGLILAVVATVLVTGANIRMPGPIIQADEGSYLANAAAIAGYDNDKASSYHAGYSLLISPAFLLARGPDAIWRLVLLVNAALYFLLCVALWKLAGKLAPDTDRPHDRVLPVLLVSAYPMWVAMAGYAFSQLAFATTFAWATLFLFKAVNRDRWHDWCLFALLAGYTYWIHPTGIVVVAVALLACLSYSMASRHVALPLTAIALTILVTLTYGSLFVPWLHSHMDLGRPASMHYPGLRATLQALFYQKGTMLSFFQHACGHLFYLIIGSAGVFLLGIAESISRIRASAAPTKRQEVPLATGVFVVLCPVGILTLSALMFSTGNSAVRLDHWIYGRYVEGALAPLLLAGAYHRAWHGVGWGIPLAVLAAWALSTGMSHYDGIAPFNIPALWQQFQPGLPGVWQWLFAGCAVMALVAILGRKSGMVCLTGLFCFAAWRQIDWHQTASGYGVDRWQSARYVRAHYRPGTCLGFDVGSSGDDYDKQVFWFDYAFQLYDYNLRGMTPSRWSKTCDGPLFSYSPSAGAASGGAQILAFSPMNGPTLWSHAPPPLAYPLRVSSQSMDLKWVLGAGWNEVEPDHVWSTRQASLHLPVPSDCVGKQCLLRLQFNLYAASTQRPVRVELVFSTATTGEQRAARVYDAVGPHMLEVPFPAAKPYVDITILVPDAVSPRSQGESGDSRPLGLSLTSLDLALDMTSTTAAEVAPPIVLPPSTRTH